MALDMFLNQLLSTHEAKASQVEIVVDNAKLSKRSRHATVANSTYCNSVVSVGHLQAQGFTSSRRKPCRWSSTEDFSTMVNRLPSRGSAMKRSSSISNILKSSQSDPTLLLMPQRCLSPGKKSKSGVAQTAHKDGSSNASWNLREIVLDDEDLEGPKQGRFESANSDLNSLMAFYDSRLASGRWSKHPQKQSVPSPAPASGLANAAPPKLPTRAPPTPNRKDEGQRRTVQTHGIPTSKLSIPPLAPPPNRVGGVKGLGSSGTSTRRSSATLRNALGSLAPGVATSQQTKSKRPSLMASNMMSKSSGLSHHSLRGSTSLTALSSSYPVACSH